MEAETAASTRHSSSYIPLVLSKFSKT